MMRPTILAVLTAAVLVSEASAVWVDSGVNYVERGYRRNVAWPWPYICPDRMAAREPFELMISNGWRRQNLLGSHHFNPETHQLTTAGELQVRWVMTQAPAGHRQIFVERSLNPEITTLHVAAAREYAAKVAIDGQTPQVSDTHLLAEGRPATIVDATNVRFQENMPVPMLPAAEYSSTGSSE